jgi:hypothetical protein
VLGIAVGFLLAGQHSRLSPNAFHVFVPIRWAYRENRPCG